MYWLLDVGQCTEDFARHSLVLAWQGEGIQACSQQAPKLLIMHRVHTCIAQTTPYRSSASRWVLARSVTPRRPSPVRRTTFTSLAKNRARMRRHARAVTLSPAKLMCSSTPWEWRGGNAAAPPALTWPSRAALRDRLLRMQRVAVCQHPRWVPKRAIHQRPLGTHIRWVPTPAGCHRQLGTTTGALS